MSEVKHEAVKDPATGRVVFGFQIGEAIVTGQVPSEAEYRALKLLFEGWRRERLPAEASDPSWVPKA
jgi:hypothetical protein